MRTSGFFRSKDTDMNKAAYQIVLATSRHLQCSIPGVSRQYFQCGLANGDIFEECRGRASRPVRHWLGLRQILDYTTSLPLSHHGTKGEP